MFDALNDLPRPCVYVFGGGGSRGAAHAGQMKALAEIGHRPDAVIGTSVGSISAAVVAENPATAADRMVEVWGSMQKADVFPGSPFANIALLGRTFTHIYGSEALRKMLRENISTIKIEDLQIPYAAVATDYEAAQPEVLMSGSLENAMVASAAIPGVFPMVEIGGKILCDGGVVANVPVVEAQLLKAKSIVVLDCMGPVDTSRDNIMDIIAGSAGIMQHKQRVADLSTVSDLLPIVYMPPPRTAGSPLNFSHTQELIEDTYESGSEFLANIKIRESPFPALYGKLPTALAPNPDGVVEPAEQVEKSAALLADKMAMPAQRLAGKLAEPAGELADKLNDLIPE